MNSNIKEITEQEVLAFCAAKSAEIASLFPELDGVYVSTTRNGWYLTGTTTDGKYDSPWSLQPTIAECVAALRQKLGTPASRAAAARAKAAELLAEAEKLEGKL